MQLFDVASVAYGAAPTAVRPTAPALDHASALSLCRALGYPYRRTAFPLLVDHLAAELQRARVLLAHRAEAEGGSAAPPTAAAAAMAPTAAPAATLDTEVLLLCKLLSVPPGSEEQLRRHPEKALAQVKAKLQALLARLPVAGGASVQSVLSLPAPLLPPSGATAPVLAMLTPLNQLLREDYATRRAMLLKRLDVTVQSFLWSARAQGREADILASVGARRRALAPLPALIRPEDAFQAGPELAAVLSERITDPSTKGLRFSSVKAVRIGAVPDRGGRVHEMRPSARDLMPEWKARMMDRDHGAGGAGGHRGGGGGGDGGYRGGRGGSHRGGGHGGGDRDRDRDRGDKGDRQRAAAILEAAGALEGEARNTEGLEGADADGDIVMEAEGRGGGGGGRGGRGGGRAQNHRHRPRGGGGGNGSGGGNTA